MEEKRENLFDSNQKTHCQRTLLDGEFGWKKERNDIKSEREREKREKEAGMGFFYIYMNGKTTRLKRLHTHVLIFLGIKNKCLFTVYSKNEKPKH